MKSYTNLEQSKKLAEILPIESADMFWADGERPAIWNNKDVSLDETDTPAWSLVALLELMPKGEGKDLLLVFGSCDGGYHPLWFCTYEEVPMILETTRSDDPVDACVEMILKLKEKNLL